MLRVEAATRWISAPSGWCAGTGDGGGSAPCTSTWRPSRRSRWRTSTRSCSTTTATAAAGRARHRRDLEILKAEAERDPRHPRTVFYIAQTYRYLEHNEEAIEWYVRRPAMGGWDEEVFYSLYQVGALRAQAGDWEHALPALIDAWEFRPTRLEPVYAIALGLRQRERYRAAHRFSSLWRERAGPTTCSS